MLEARFEESLQWGVLLRGDLLQVVPPGGAPSKDSPLRGVHEGDVVNDGEGRQLVGGSLVVASGSDQQTVDASAKALEHLCELLERVVSDGFLGPSASLELHGDGGYFRMLLEELEPKIPVTRGVGIEVG